MHHIIIDKWMQISVGIFIGSCFAFLQYKAKLHFPSRGQCDNKYILSGMQIMRNLIYWNKHKLRRHHCARWWWPLPVFIQLVTVQDGDGHCQSLDSLSSCKMVMTMNSNEGCFCSLLTKKSRERLKSRKQLTGFGTSRVVPKGLKLCSSHSN